MIRLRIKLKNSIFSRLIFTFLLIAMPMYAVGIGVYKWGISTVKSEILSSTVSKVSFSVDNFERDIQRIQNIQFDCLNDENLNELANASEILNQYSKTEDILRLQQRLLIVKNSNAYIMDVRAYIPAINKVISANSGPGDIPQAEFDILKQTSPMQDLQTIFWNNRLFVNSKIILKELPDKESTPYIVTSELSVNEIRNALVQFNYYDKGGTLLINSEQNYMISTDTNKENNKIISQFILKKLSKSSSGNDTITINDKSYLVVYITSPYLNMTLCKYIPENDVFKSLDRYKALSWITSFVFIIIIVLFLFSTSRLIHKPLKRLIESFHKVEDGNLNISIQHKRDDEFGYLYERFNAMVDNLKMLIDQVYKQKILAQKAELKQLQSQINPHFLYNSFFMLNRMVICEDYENSVKITQQLGNYFKFITRNAADEVPLFKEIEHSRIYSDIQAMRFRNRIIISFDDLPEIYKGILVPRIILQPLIENSIEHGLRDKEKDGVVCISFKEEHNTLYIMIEDNGDSMTNSDIEDLKLRLSNYEEGIESTAIINIHRRIKLKFGNNYGINIFRSDIGGIKVEISLPVEVTYV